MSSWHSYPKVYNIGHPAIVDLLADDVIVEEKIDGSQFSFGIFGGDIKVKSKSNEMIVDAPEKMFQRAVDTVLAIAPMLHDGWTYRAEYLQKPKHNVLAYDRIPNNHLILFDVNTDEEAYLCYDEKYAESERLGLECVPLLKFGTLNAIEQMTELLETVSVLGGQKVEGVVIKNYQRFGRDGKVLMGKHVSEAFREVHKKDWKLSNPGRNDVVAVLQNKYRTEARWNKAVQHLRERGELENDPRDIGKLMKECQLDTMNECAEEIRDALFRWAWPQIGRAITRGLPEWYKNSLMERQFVNAQDALEAQS